MLGCYFVQFRWITIPASSAYLLWHGHWWLALLTLLTTFVTGLLTSFTRGQAGVVQERFLLQLLGEAVLRQSTVEPMNDLISGSVKSRISDASVREICADWPYEIESLADSLPDLHEFSTSEYSLLPKSFAHERIYNASPMLFAGKQWDVVIGAINGRIYKLAPCISMFSEKEANAAFLEIHQLCVRAFGNATEHRIGQAIWDCSDGNVILRQAGALGYHQIDLIVTSSAVRFAPARG
jgi:hypothetical protein